MQGDFNQIIQGYFNGNGAIMWLPSSTEATNPEE